MISTLQKLFFVAGSFWCCAVSTVAATTSLPAVTTATVRASGLDTSNYNRLVAYDRVDVFGPIDGKVNGFIKFDLSSIPDASTIGAMTLTLYAEEAFGAPAGAPEIQVWRSSFDSWVRGGIGFPTAYDDRLTESDAGPFPSSRHTPYTFILDTDALNWSEDLADNTLSLVLVESSATSNDYMYWFGSDGVSSTGNAESSGANFSFVPTLTVNYTPIPEPASSTLAVAALCLATRRKTRLSQQ